MGEIWQIDARQMVARLIVAQAIYEQPLATEDACQIRWLSVRKQEVAGFDRAPGRLSLQGSQVHAGFTGCSRDVTDTLRPFGRHRLPANSGSSVSSVSATTGASRIAATISGF